MNAEIAGRGREAGRVSRNLAAFAGLADRPSPRPSPIGWERKTKRGAFWWGLALMMAVGPLLFGGGLPGWKLMWIQAGALFFAAKWITVFDLIHSGRPCRNARVVAYIFLWPGMNARAFCCGLQRNRPNRKDYVAGVFNVLAGIALFLTAAVIAATEHWLIAGWLAMISIVLILHFGMFRLLADFWRECGVDARPIMRSPATATSLSKLWSGRWNTAFTDLMHAHAFAPIARRYGPAMATLFVFLISGLLHELVISAPARGGYGLPTAYFLLQCAGVFIERSAVGQKLGLNSGFSGWFFVLMIAVVPAMALFPPVFVQNVIIPMLHSFQTALL